MTNTSAAPNDIQRRIKFLSLVLGIMIGLGLVSIAMSIYLRSPFLVAPVMVLVVTAIPLVRALKRLRRAEGPTV
jgi:hypothetical protein